MTGQFSDFYNSLDADPAKRGKQFEHFVNGSSRPIPNGQLRLTRHGYGRNGRGADCGIDLVLRHKNGENWAVQAT